MTIGVNAGDNWTAKMIEHHQGAIDMSRIVLAQKPDATGGEARSTNDPGGDERRSRSFASSKETGSPDQVSASLYQSRDDVHAQGHDRHLKEETDISETYVRKLLEHHKGAVAMSDVALGNGVAGELREKIQKTRSYQQKEAAMIKAMLRGEPMTQAQQTWGTEPAAQDQG